MSMQPGESNEKEMNNEEEREQEKKTRNFRCFYNFLRLHPLFTLNNQMNMRIVHGKVVNTVPTMGN